MTTLRYWAAARDAAGVDSEEVLPGTLEQVLAEARSRHSERFAVVLSRCTFAVDSSAVGGTPHGSVDVPAGAQVDVLPPFAGG